MADSNRDSKDDEKPTYKDLEEPTIDETEHDEAVEPKHDAIEEEQIDELDEKMLAETSAEVEEKDVEPATKPTVPAAIKKKNPLQKAKHWLKLHPRKSAALGVLAVVAIILIVPPSRYPILSVVKKQSVTVVVQDAQTQKPVTEAEVLLRGRTVKTNKDGQAVFANTKLGKASVHVSKTYYRIVDSSITVGLRSPSPLKTALQATGRQVPVTVTNKITGQPVANVLVQALGSKARTDKQGKLSIVLPADKSTAAATLSGSGYNQATTTLKITTSNDPQNIVTVTPVGTVYFLSKLSGKIDVVKTNLDGTDRKTVLPGTGNEEDRGTVLLASKDWKYLALQSKRDSANPKLYLINTATDQLTTMDEGDAIFNITGWLGHDFVYQVTKNNANSWVSGTQSIKSYDADAQKLNMLDQTNAEGTSANDFANEAYGQVFALKGIVLFNKNWQASYNTLNRLDGKQATIVTIKGDGTGKVIQKSLARNTNDIVFGFDSRAYEPGGVYYKDLNSSEFFEYEDGKVAPNNDVTTDKFYNASYPTYLESPGATQDFWSESRDGKNTLFLGDNDGKNAKQIASLSDYTQFGWYTDNYLLVSKNSSELYIMAKDGKHPAIKISDYHKPEYNYVGYGGGYGGI